MSIVKIIWAAVLASMLGYCYIRSGKWEKSTGKVEGVFGDEVEKQTYAFVPASFFVIVFAVLALMSYVIKGRTGLIETAAFFFEIVILISVYFLILLAILPFLRTKISARACATMWVVPVMLLYNVYMLMQGAGVPRFTFYIGKGTVKTLIIVWLAGFVAVFGYFLSSHLIMWSRMKKGAYPPNEGSIIKIWDALCRELGYGSRVKLLLSDTAATPFSTGLFKRYTVLPRGNYTESELKMILTHELRHLQRCDVDAKLFLSFCNAICWFNPLVWLATKKAAEDLELSCDEVVTADMDENERKSYAELLLKFSAPQSGFTTCLSAAAGTLRYRMKNVVMRKKLMGGAALLMVSVFICAMSFGAFAITDEKGTVGELILTHPENIRSMYVKSEFTDGNMRTLSKWEDEIISTIKSLEIEHISDGISYSGNNDRFLELFCDDSERLFITVYDNILEVKNTASQSEYYIIKSELDWEKLMTYVEVMPEITFDETYSVLYLGEDENPISLVQLSCDVTDNATGNILTAWSIEDTPTQILAKGEKYVRLDFNQTPVKLTVTVLDGGGNEITTVKYEDFNAKDEMSLIDGGVTYRLSSEYECSGMTYVSQYAFEIEK